LIQAGFTRDSVISAVTSGDMTLLQADPLASTPSITARETITADAGGKTGQPPGVQTVLTKPQTPASKMPMPASLKTPPSATGRPRAPSANGG
jgi:hypothetical protein